MWQVAEPKLVVHLWMVQVVGVDSKEDWYHHLVAVVENKVVSSIQGWLVKGWQFVVVCGALVHGGIVVMVVGVCKWWLQKVSCTENEKNHFNLPIIYHFLFVSCLMVMHMVKGKEALSILQKTK